MLKPAQADEEGAQELQVSVTTVASSKWYDARPLAENAQEDIPGGLVLLDKDTATLCIQIVENGPLGAVS